MSPQTPLGVIRDLRLGGKTVWHLQLINSLYPPQGLTLTAPLLQNTPRSSTLLFSVKKYEMIKMARSDVCLNESVFSLRVSSRIWTLFSHMIAGVLFDFLSSFFFTWGLIWGLRHQVLVTCSDCFISTLFWCKCLFFNYKGQHAYIYIYIYIYTVII